jgi:hypothetical protein
MLVLRRSDGQWVEVTHRSGDVLRFRVYDLCREGAGRIHLAFEDSERNFNIQRPERSLAANPAPSHQGLQSAGGVSATAGLLVSAVTRVS